MNPQHYLRPVLSLAIGLLVCAQAPAQRGAPFPFEEGDKIAFVGGTFFERDVRYGYLETFLTARLKDKALNFRNLAWSGDTVWGEARASFDTAKEGYERLLKNLRAYEPSVIMLAYGGNEAFGGTEKLREFHEGYNRLLQDLAELNARFVIIAPPLHESETSPLPDVQPINSKIAAYSAALSDLAEEQGHFFIDFESALTSLRLPGAPLTDNGMHFTEYGYWKAGQALCAALGYPVPVLQEVDEAPFTLDATVFFSPALPVDAPEAAKESEVYHTLRFEAPESGQYQLFQGINTYALHSDTAWRTGIRLHGVQETGRAHSLHAAILEKNRLFFNQWRPQNETYILGFRKYEQGQYAEEIPLFDPLIEDMEEQIRHLLQFEGETFHIEVAAQP